MSHSSAGKKTDWDAYYRRPIGPVQITRRISAAKLRARLRAPLSQPDVSVCELGGANSCFIDDFLKRDTVARYHVVDSNAYGAQLLRQRFQGDARVTVETADALELGQRDGEFDIVYSIGLIEHFAPPDTARCISAHFALCRPGGVVLMTFPTPTWLYKAIRAAAEWAKMWRFPDERPLSFEEVVRTATHHGQLDHRSINWMIGLTQGYVVCTKNEA